MEQTSSKSEIRTDGVAADGDISGRQARLRAYSSKRL
jgi:hypothetical protein